MTAVKFTNKKQKQIKQGRTKQETVSIMKLDFHGFPRLARWPRRKGLTLELRKKQTSAISINSLVLVSILLSQSRFRKINGTCSSPVVQLYETMSFSRRLIFVWKWAQLLLCWNLFNKVFQSWESDFPNQQNVMQLQYLFYLLSFLN